MEFTTQIKLFANRWLKMVNLRVETLTAEKVERNRLEALEQSGQFAEPVFLLPPAFQAMEVTAILEGVCRYKQRFDDFEDPSHNSVEYAFNNTYFTSPDAEVLYVMVRDFAPGKVIEIGSGHSTKIIRQAILDGRLKTRLVSIDPCPRTEITKLVDEFYPKPVEITGKAELFESLRAGDILFVDSSHEIKTGNDVVFLYLNVLPRLSPGVLVHIHDIFLPYDYPREWVIEERWGFNEQYLVQSLLMSVGTFEVLWAGHFLQHTQPNFAQHFPRLNGLQATSLWLRKAS